MRHLKPICVPCQRFFRPEKNGYYFTEGMPQGDGARPGKVDDASWTDYKLWVGDLWKCPGCGALIIEGVNGPVAERHHEGFHEQIQARGAKQFRVNDC